MHVTPLGVTVSRTRINCMNDLTISTKVPGFNPTRLFRKLGHVLCTLIRIHHRHLYYSNHGTMAIPQWASSWTPIQTFGESQNVLVVLAPDTRRIDIYHTTKNCQQKRNTVVDKCFAVFDTAASSRQFFLRYSVGRNNGITSSGRCCQPSLALCDRFPDERPLARDYTHVLFGLARVVCLDLT